MENVTTETATETTVTATTETVVQTAEATKLDGRRGPRKTGDAAAPYGVKKDGTPRQKPGKKPALKTA